MALFERDRLPARSTLSRFLASLTEAPVEALRSLFLDDQIRRQTVRKFVRAPSFPEWQQASRTKSVIDPYRPYCKSGGLQDAVQPTNYGRSYKNVGLLAVGRWSIGGSSCNRTRVLDLPLPRDAHVGLHHPQ